MLPYPRASAHFPLHNRTSLDLRVCKSSRATHALSISALRLLTAAALQSLFSLSAAAAAFTLQRVTLNELIRLVAWQVAASRPSFVREILKTSPSSTLFRPPSFVCVFSTLSCVNLPLVALLSCILFSVCVFFVHHHDYSLDIRSSAILTYSPAVATTHQQIRRPPTSSSKTLADDLKRALIFHPLVRIMFE